MNTQKVLFKETQTNIFLIIPFVAVALFFGMLCLVQVSLHHTMGNHPLSNLALVLIFVGSIIAAIFFGSQKLKLLITDEEIQVSYGVFTGTQVIRVNEIKSIGLRKYNGFKEFRGWGVKYNKDTSCFTISGDDGIAIEMADNRKFLIGTHRANAVRSVLASLPVQFRQY